ncbi:MAG: PEP-CTERM sorting domain-containing protein [Acidobacteria bacterium]|nr:PEP-CTERM sorting domain-containing protein [Acidobacteriota bacterium]
MKQLIKIVLCGIVLLSGTTIAQAVTLAELLDDGSITAGDKLFDDWELLDYESSQPDRSFNYGNIVVTPLNDGGLDPGPGLTFDILNQELWVTADENLAFVDLLLGFRVSVLDPGLQIVDGSLGGLDGSISYSMDGDNDVGFYIHETIGTFPWDDGLGVNETEFSVLNGTETEDTTATAGFEPQNAIWVTQNIRVWATDTDTARLNSFDQRFSQTQTVVPEPSTFALMFLGLAGLFVARNRKN